MCYVKMGNYVEGGNSRYYGFYEPFLKLAWGEMIACGVVEISGIQSFNVRFGK